MDRIETDTATTVVHLSNGNSAGGELLAATGPFSHQTSDPDRPSVDHGADQGARDNAAHGQNKLRAPEFQNRPRAPHGWWLLPFSVFGAAIIVKIVFGAIAWWLQ